jgi:hypothetical protein
MILDTPTSSLDQASKMEALTTTGKISIHRNCACIQRTIVDETWFVVRAIDLWELWRVHPILQPVVQSILQTVNLLSDRLIVTRAAGRHRISRSALNASDEKVAENRVDQDEM